MESKLRVLVTGAEGFIGKNLISHLRRFPDIEIDTFLHSDSIESLGQKVLNAGFIFHLAGVNRPKSDDEFGFGNRGLTEMIGGYIRDARRHIPLIYSSSTQATLSNPYGVSKYQAEKFLINLMYETGSPVSIYRLPNVFGKWSRPNYNSVVATFCHNIANNLPININDPEANLSLVYIDDVVASFIGSMRGGVSEGYINIKPVYEIQLGALAKQLYKFKHSRNDLILDGIGNGITRALYSTYISFLKPDQFSYPLLEHTDVRGRFVEMIKTTDSGQISFFTAHPGITRGGHYHHSKSEKFLVVKGEAKFRFRNILSGDSYEICVSEKNSTIIETVPGWSHDITNTGKEELLVMLWANELFNAQEPDTFAYEV